MAEFPPVADLAPESPDVTELFPPVTDLAPLGPQETVFTDTGTVGEQLRAGAVETKSTFGSSLQVAGKLLGIDPLTKYGEEVQATADKDLETLPQPARVEDAFQSPGKFFEWVTHTAARNAAMTGGLLATGVGAAAAGAPTAVGLGLVGGVSAFLSAGDVYAELRKEGVDRPGAAAAAGLGIGLLDALPVTHLVGQGRKIIGAGLPAGSIIKTALKEGGKQAAEEAITETVQEGIQLGTRAAVATPATEAETLSRLINSAAAGGLLGGLSGAGIGSASYQLGKRSKIEAYDPEPRTDVPIMEVTPGGYLPEPKPFSNLTPTDISDVISNEKKPAPPDFSKKSVAGLADEIVNTLKEVRPDELRAAMRGEEVASVTPERLQTVQTALREMDSRGIEADKQDSLIRTRYEKQLGLEAEVAKANVAAYKPLLESLRSNVPLERGDIIVTYPGPQGRAMEAATRAFVPDAKVFIAPAEISTPVTHYADGQYLLSVKDAANFDKALGAVVVQEALNKLTPAQNAKVMKAFSGSNTDNNFAQFIAQNIDTLPELALVKEALNQYEAQRGQEPVALREWLGENFATLPPDAELKRLINLMQKAAEPTEKVGKENITSIDPVLSAAGLTAQDIEGAKFIDKMVENVVEPQRIDEVKISLLKANWFSRNFLTLLQFIKENAALRPLQDYGVHVNEWAALKNLWQGRAQKRLEGLKKLGATTESKVWKTLLDATVKSHEAEAPLTAVEIEQLAKDNNVPKDHIAVIFDVLKDFQDFLAAVEQAQIAQAARAKVDPETRQQLLKDIQDDFARLRNRTYFPLARFGKYTVLRTIKKTATIDGKLRQVGDVDLFETYDREGEQASRIAELKKDRPHLFDVGGRQMTDAERSLIGFPTSMVESLAEDMKLSAKQISTLKDYLFKFAPGRTFSKHLAKRAGTAGYSQDGARAYADYFMSGASHLGRVTFSDLLANDINQVSALAREGARQGLVTNKLDRIHAYMTQHRSDSMNPAMDYAMINRAIFSYYFAGNLLQPAINMLQVGMVTMPYLSAKFGHVETMKALGQAYKTVAQGAKATHSERAQRIHERLQKAGITDESYAAEVASVAAGDLLRQTATSGHRFGAAFSRLTQAATFPFRWTELLNRRVTAQAVINLTENLSEEEAYTAARQAIQNTHGELAGWNRPQAVRGGVPAVMYAMKGFTQMMLYHMARQPGGRETLLYTLAATGLMGLPFAGDLGDLGDLVLSVARQLGLYRGQPDTDRLIKEGLQAMGLDYNWVQHGAARSSMGMYGLAHMFGVPMPQVDISQNLSMGRIVPGMKELVEASRMVIGDPSGRDVDSVMSRGVEDAFGPAGSVGGNTVRAATSNDPQKFWRAVNAMPTAVRRAMRAFRAFTEGEYKDSNGNRLDQVDTSDPEQMAELAMYGLGFTPTRLAVKQELSWAKREEASYWLTRKDMLLNQYAIAAFNRDQQDLSAMRRAVQQHNNEAPVGYKMSGADISAGIRTRIRNRTLKDVGLPPSKRLIPSGREQERLRNLLAQAPSPLPSPSELSSE